MFIRIVFINIVLQNFYKFIIKFTYEKVFRELNTEYV